MLMKKIFYLSNNCIKDALSFNNEYITLNVAGEHAEKCDAMRSILAGYLTRKLEN